MTAEKEGAEPGAHAPYVGGASVVALALGIPVLISMLALAIAPGVLQMAQEFGALTAQLVLTVPAMVMIVGAAISGYLSERWGRRAVISACLLVYAIAGVSGGMAPSLTLLVTARVVSGFVGGVLLTSVYAVIGEYFEGGRRESLLGFMSTAASIASLGLLVVMGYVVERFGWRAPFMLYGVSLLLIPCALRGLHRGLSAASVSLSWRPVLRGWTFYLLLTGYTVGMYMMVIQGPFLMAAKGFTAPSTIGQFIGLSSLVGAICSAFYGLMRRWLGFRQMFVLISLAIGLGLPLAAWAPSGAWVLLSMIVVGVGIGIIEPTVASELLLRTPEPLHDRAMGVNVAAMFLGQFLNPLLLAPVREAYGIAFAFTAVGLAYLLAAGLFAASIGHRWTVKPQVP
ncbi:MFS transporter [Sphingobium sp. EP60837]|uniref:MFS transporter n=1 Tax=Sphingobium sp. EP60837 TaxID=1855519 RepID=UPI0007DCDA5F|nr:MFS transporter [Sphingobium sp. EP60837]ANI79965.1 putative MFS-type transporter YtbD [Sphingobium sp. EP60837]